MMQNRQFWPLALLWATSLMTAGGCAEGPMYYLASLNPVIRNQWDEDEAYMTSLHTKLSELELVRQQADGMTPAEAEQWIMVLTGITRDESNARLRAAAVETLANFAGPQVDEALQSALQDSNPTVRMAACRAWGSERPGAESARLLAGVIGADTDPDVRMAAARELANFPDDRQAVEGLAQALDDDDPALRYRATESLRAITGVDYGPDADAWREYIKGGNPTPPPAPSLVERVRRWF